MTHQCTPPELRVIALPGGRTLTVRPSTPGDVEGLRLLYEGLSIDDRYRRFFNAWHPSREFLGRWASVAERGGFGLVAVEGDARRPGTVAGVVVGEAAYTPLPDGDGELALAVASEWRGWLGHYLLDALLTAAAARGIPNLQADILLENRPMLALVRARGYAVLDHSNLTTVRVTIGAATRVPTWPDGHDRPRVLVETPSGQWHAEAAVRSAGYRVVGCPEPFPGARSHCPVLAGATCPLAADADVVVFGLRADDPRSEVVLGAQVARSADVPLCAELSDEEAAGLHLPADVPRLRRGAPAPEILDVLRQLVGTLDPARCAGGDGGSPR